MAENKSTLCVSDRLLYEVVEQAIADGKIDNKANFLNLAARKMLMEMGYDVPENRASKTRLTDSEIDKVIMEYVPGLNGQEIANRYDISLSGLIHAMTRRKKALEKEVNKSRAKTQDMEVHVRLRNALRRHGFEYVDKIVESIKNNHGYGEIVQINGIGYGRIKELDDYLKGKGYM